MTRLYGRAASGQRVHEATPQSHWTVVTLIGALRVSGMVAPMTVEAATGGEIFLAYVEHFLCPALRPEDVVVMDNLSAHKVDGVRQLIETTGAKLLYLLRRWKFDKCRISGSSGSQSFEDERGGDRFAFGLSQHGDFVASGHSTRIARENPMPRRHIRRNKHPFTWME